MGGQQCPSSNNIDGLIVIVTGSSGGIGLEIVKDLCKRGAHVIMACRNIEKAEESKQLVVKLTPAAKIECRYLDLLSFDCIKRFVKSIGKFDSTFLNVFIIVITFLQRVISRESTH